MHNETDMRITVHRPNQIGGCITEIKSDSGTRIIIDVGSNLPGNAVGKEVDVAKITKGCDAVFITHYHGDHIGEFEKVDGNTPIYMGSTAHEIFLNLCEHLPDKNVDAVRDFKTFQPAEKIMVGDMVITPYRVDHSAYDSYMFLIQCDGKRILHTGDFRTHGWTGKGVNAVLDKHIKKVDVLICEGTMLSRQGEELLTEYDLCKKATTILRDHRHVFVLCSSTNINTIASFYKAANTARRLVVADRYQRLNMDIISENARSPLYKFPYVKIFLPDRQDCIDEMRRRGFCMFVRASRPPNVEKNKFKILMEQFPDSLLVYSMWNGYLREETLNKDIYDFIPKDANGNLSYKYLHTGGHATEEAIIELCEIIRPDIILPIHSADTGRFEELDSDSIKGKVVRLKDEKSVKI